MAQNSAYCLLSLQNSPKKFCGCQVIREKCEIFLPQIKSNIWYMNACINLGAFSYTAIKLQNQVLVNKMQDEVFRLHVTIVCCV